MTESAGAKTCPECGISQDRAVSRRALAGWWLWLPIVLAFVSLAVLLGLGARSKVTTPPTGPLPPDGIEQTRGLLIAPLPTLGSLRRLAADGNADVDLASIINCASARTDFPMPDESTVRVSAVEGLRIAEYHQTSYGWPVRFVSASVQQGVDVREPNANAITFKPMPARWTWSWREVGRSWQDADGRPRTMLVHWTALCFGMVIVASAVLVRDAIDSRHRGVRRCVLWGGLILTTASLSMPTHVGNKSSTIGLPIGQAAPTGYKLSELRDAAKTAEGRAAFAMDVASIVDRELVAASSKSGVFYRRTREFDGGPHDSGPVHTAAQVPRDGWPDSTGVLFYVTAPPTTVASRSDRWGEQDRWTISRWAWNEAHPLRSLGLEVGASLFSWSVRWTRNVGGTSEKWMLAVDRLSEWLGLALVIPIGVLALRVIWFERRVSRRVERRQCVGCGYSLIGLPQSPEKAQA